jgi:hypothetical protein
VLILHKNPSNECRVLLDTNIWSYIVDADAGPELQNIFK